MKNREYWKTSLCNVLEKEDVTDKLVEKIIGISEMEYEYTEFESHKPSEIDINPLEKTLKKLENDIIILSNYIASVKKVDSVSVENGRVSLYSKLP